MRLHTKVGVLQHPHPIGAKSKKAGEAMEWVLMMYMATTKPPEIVAKGYETAEQCEMAAELITKADNAARNAERQYSVLCKETPKAD